MTALSWTQPICLTCWDERNPGRNAARLLPEVADVERCAYCGCDTQTGIYVRDNPANVAYPQPKDEA